MKYVTLKASVPSVVFLIQVYVYEKPYTPYNCTWATKLVSMDFILILSPKLIRPNKKYMCGSGYSLGKNRVDRILYL